MSMVIKEHRICVSNLDPDIGLADLRGIFSLYGEVCCVSLDERRRFGFVSYRHKREARWAIEDMGRLRLIGSPTRVEWAFGWPRETSDESDTEPLAFLRTQPEFQQIRQQIGQKPLMMFDVLEKIGRNNPRLLLLICENWREFLRMLKDTEGPSSHQPVVAGTGASPLGEATAQVSPQDRDAIGQGLQDLPVESEPQQQGTTPPGGIQSFNRISIPTGNDAEPLAFLRTLPEFQLIRRNPRLLLLIARNPEEFLRMLKEPEGPSSHHPVVAGTGTRPLESSLAQDRDAIGRATALLLAVTPRNSQLQSEPDIHDTGLAIAPVPESVEPTEPLAYLRTPSEFQRTLQNPLPESVEPTEPLAYLRTPSEFQRTLQRSQQLQQERQQRIQHRQHLIQQELQRVRQLEQERQQVEQRIQHREHLIQQIEQRIGQLQQQNQHAEHMIQQIRQDIPISQNQEEFVRMLHEPQGPASAQPVVAGTRAIPLESSLREATAQVSPQDREAIERATPSSTSDASRSSQLQSEPAIFSSGLAVASVPESVEPNGATNTKDTEVEKKVEVKKVNKKVKKTKTVDFQCKICLDKQIRVVFLPCGHLVSCRRCAKRISICPMCRELITDKVRTYV